MNPERCESASSLEGIAEPGRGSAARSGIVESEWPIRIRLRQWLGRSVFRYSCWDLLLMGGALVYGILLVWAPSVVLIAVGFWWTANTVAHYFVHLPFFRRRWQNRLFSAFLTLLLGLPQWLWRGRHLAHHAGVRWKLRFSKQLLLESGIAASLWTVLAVWDSQFLLGSYLPGWLLGLTLCHVHGYFEHYRGTTSYYGRLYNWLFFNDGYHVEHHSHPGYHWRILDTAKDASVNVSGWPAIFRWAEFFSLEGLERMLLRIPPMHRWMVQCHREAFARALVSLPPPTEVGIIGGGLFPRTPLVVQELYPTAKITVIDMSRPNLDCARQWLGDRVEYICAQYTHRDAGQFDWLIVPLSFRGDRTALYTVPPARVVVVHDWIWRRRGRGTIVSWLLLKRINVVMNGE